MDNFFVRDLGEAFRDFVYASPSEELRKTYEEALAFSRVPPELPEISVDDNITPKKVREFIAEIQTDKEFISILQVGAILSDDRFHDSESLERLQSVIAQSAKTILSSTKNVYIVIRDAESGAKHQLHGGKSSPVLPTKFTRTPFETALGSMIFELANVANGNALLDCSCKYCGGGQALSDVVGRYTQGSKNANVNLHSLSNRKFLQAPRTGVEKFSSQGSSNPSRNRRSIQSALNSIPSSLNAIGYGSDISVSAMPRSPAATFPSHGSIEERDHLALSSNKCAGNRVRTAMGSSIGSAMSSDDHETEQFNTNSPTTYANEMEMLELRSVQRHKAIVQELGTSFVQSPGVNYYRNFRIGDPGRQEDFLRHEYVKTQHAIWYIEQWCNACGDPVVANMSVKKVNSESDDIDYDIGTSQDNDSGLNNSSTLCDIVSSNYSERLPEFVEGPCPTGGESSSLTKLKNTARKTCSRVRSPDGFPAQIFLRDKTPYVILCFPG